MSEEITASVRQWVETVVIDLNLCPFAQRELLNDRVRFSTTAATSDEQLLHALHEELEHLNNNPTIETTLLILPNMLPDFYEFNDFLRYTDGLLDQMDLVGIYQIASFHPDYQFEGTKPADVENYTNRSPYPVLHLIREESLEQAIASYPDVDEIPERNIALMNSLGQSKLQALLEACLR